ncbi:MAG: Ig-like domain-containing protein [Anaerostipes sp.]|nr:Ig-like domain-containing protein [Anaerostipes sp.]
MSRKYRISVIIGLIIIICAMTPVYAKKAYIKVSSSTKVSIPIGKSSKIKAVSKGKKRKLTYKSSNKKIATVTSKGTIKGKKYGSASIYIKGKNLKTKKIKVYIKKEVKGLTLKSLDTVFFETAGRTSQIRAITNPSSKVVTTKLNYRSANTKIATVSSTGKITAKKAGLTTIYVSTNKNCTKSSKVYTKKITVFVFQPVTRIQANNIQVKIGESKPLNAVITPSNATNKVLNYSIANATVAYVSNEGVVTGLKSGTTTVTIKSDDGFAKTTANVTVEASEDTYQWPEGVKKLSGSTDIELQVEMDIEKLNNKVEILFKDKNGGNYAYSMLDIEDSFQKLREARDGAAEEKGGIKVEKIRSKQFMVTLLSTGERFKLTVDYDKYGMTIRAMSGNVKGIRFNAIS